MIRRAGEGREKWAPPITRPERPTESFLEPPACKKLLFFPNYDFFFFNEKGKKPQSSNLGLHQDCVTVSGW